ncbi:allatostatin-A receptor-like [Paramacrobiotus metropolitanus]|uniref:allatostatin-A receptor-like n=1 Tax=Paramacrobiotus metropolitanus TaxID=2943436 RepID=UPI002445C291|nr:allatostatin-A receptor-like [Paramacrobiotus metropolitanus]
MWNVSNITEPLHQTWTYGAIGRLTFCILQLCLNIGMLCVFIFRPALRSTFTVYIMALLSFNIFYCAGQYPLEVIRQTYPRWWLSEHACRLYLYEIWVVCSATMHMHVLITINRLWAVVFPVSYRQNHTTKVAVLMCLGMVTYVHLVCFPLYIRDQLYFHQSASEHGCVMNIKEQNLYSTLVALIGYDLPIAFVVFAYPFLLYKHKQRGRSVHGATTGPSKTLPTSETRGSVSHAHRSRTNSIHPHGGRKGNVRPFLVLTLLTISVFVCWTPDTLFWTISCFTTVTEFPTVETLTMVLYSMQAVMDPIIFAMSLASFRAYVVQSYRSWCCRKN